MTQPDSKRLVTEARFTAVSNAATAAAQSQIDASAAAAASSAAAAQNSANLVGAPADSTIATAINGTGTSTRAAVETLAGTARVIYVSTSGNDSASGKAWGSAKATITGALTALGSSSGIVRIGAGSFTTADTHTYVGGVVFEGQGSGETTINYTGTGTLFKSGTSAGLRLYYPMFTGLELVGPGKATATVGVDLEMVTSATLNDVVVRLFGKGVRIYGTGSGGAVYNQLNNVTASSCSTGFSIEPQGTNATRMFGCRANSCDVGLDITDSNNTTWLGGQVESCTTGVRVTSSAVALADHNIVGFTRFEGNTTAWNVTSVNVRDFQIICPTIFATYTIIDNGTRTAHWGNTGSTSAKMASAAAISTGSWRFERTINGGASLPAFVVRDGVSTSGTPVTVQAETERVNGSFYRGLRGGVTVFDVRADGVVTEVAVITPPIVKTSSYAARIGDASLPGDGTIIANGAAVTITLPDPTTVTAGRRYTVKNINASAVTVVSAGTTKTIDGAASASLAQWARGVYLSDGAQWLTV